MRCVFVAFLGFSYCPKLLSSLITYC